MEFAARMSASATLALLTLVLSPASAGDEPIRLIVENSEFYREVKLDYGGGERYPHLERVEQRADLLTPILAPRTP